MAGPRERRLLVRQGRASRSNYPKGGAARFDQEQGAVPELRVPSNASLVPGAGTMSICGWLYLKDTANPTIHIMVKQGGSTATDEWFFHIINSTTLRFGFSNGSAYSVVAWSSAITAAAWHFFYADWDGTNLHINLDNGTPVALAGTGPIASGSNPVRFGADSADGTDMNAFIDAFAFWKGRVLTATEQTVLFNNNLGLRFNNVPASFLANLSAWWDFDGKSASMWLDSYGTNDALDVNNSVVVDAGKT